MICMIPANIFLLLWIWFGRAAFGAGGWLMIFGFAYVSVFIAGVVITGVLAQKVAGFPAALTRSQALAQLTQWSGMLGFGFFLVDVGDAPDSESSAFTELVGRSDANLSLSWALTGLSTGIAFVGWLALLVLLIMARRRGRVHPLYSS